MALTSIGQQKTPGRPIEITFAADTGFPSDSQPVLLIGHAEDGTTGTNTVIVINNSGDLAAASGEATAKFGAESELTKMVVAAVKANSGSSTYPLLKVCPLADAETTIPVAAQTAIARTQASFIVTPYDLQTDSANRTILKNLAQLMSGAQRTDNNQFGSFGVGANQSESNPSDLFLFDTQFLIGCWLPDTDPTYSLGEIAAACAAKMAGNGVPFNPLDDITVIGIPAPENSEEWITVGAGLESESCLNQGWTPLFVKPNEEVAFVRTVTGRISADGTGSPPVASYYDVQDFQTLYFWRKTLWTRFSQPDFKQRKASQAAAVEIKSEAIRLAVNFQDNNMFQAVQQLAKEFIVERNASDRSRFDFKTPVNVIPGLHVIAGNIVATTAFDTITV